MNNIFRKIKWLCKYYFGVAKHAQIIDARKLYAVWEYSHLSKIFDYLDVDCVFDIGANQGQYAEMLRKKAGFQGYIFSFEPNPRDAKIAKNLAQTDSKWIVSELAISEADGFQQFNVMQSSQFSSLSSRPCRTPKPRMNAGDAG